MLRHRHTQTASGQNLIDNTMMCVYWAVHTPSFQRLHRQGPSNHFPPNRCHLMLSKRTKKRLSGEKETERIFSLLQTRINRRQKEGEREREGKGRSEEYDRPHEPSRSVRIEPDHLPSRIAPRAAQPATINDHFSPILFLRTWHSEHVAMVCDKTMD